MIDYNLSRSDYLLNKRFVSKAECTTFFAVSSLTTPLPLGYHRDDDRMAADFFRLLVLVFRLFIVFLYCLSQLMSPVIFLLFFLLFCIPLVYLWYSLIPSQVLSNHPPPYLLPILLFPSGTYIPPCNSVPFWKLRLLRRTALFSGTSASFRNLRPIRKFRPF
jgi:hypothetical protein